MANERTVLIENRSRDQKDFGKIEVGGKIHHVILGSSDDRDGAPLHKGADGSVNPGTPGSWNGDFPNPAATVPLDVFQAYRDDKARGPMINAWLNTGEITVDGRRH